MGKAHKRINICSAKAVMSALAFAWLFRACRGEEAKGDRAEALAKAGDLLRRSFAWLCHRCPALWAGSFTLCPVV
jgi:hypothetical protein